ncbi:basic blue protein-like [Macadamia integrifolia]|uniref:basic blue protein-like n=1 Tax=Macadamia integrifolia TaxID=60698 RepID=UPI001C4ED4D0|nr:basic blue protein-like [Macadamia integrifolia]
MFFNLRVSTKTTVFHLLSQLSDTMAPHGQVNPNQTVVTTIAFLFCILISINIACATTYTVGDSSGWNFNVRDWPTGKTFTAGDTLVFKYNPLVHNVVKVDIEGYNNCEVPQGAKVFTSGNDSIAVSVGHNYFICGFPGHCNMGLKIDINGATKAN